MLNGYLILDKNDPSLILERSQDPINQSFGFIKGNYTLVNEGVYFF